MLLELLQILCYSGAENDDIKKVGNFDKHYNCEEEGMGYSAWKVYV